MADYDGLKPGEILADASVAEFIKTLGLSIAEAQQALDENSVNQIAEFIEPREGLGGKTLLDLGLSPAFYHYQHADITCSMQLSLKVEKDLSLGLNIGGSYSNTETENNNSSQNESSSESGSSTRTETRRASIQVTSASAGSLTVGGRAFPLSGNSPLERIQNLRNSLTGDPSTGIARVLYRMQPTPLTITTDATAEEVTTTENSVAFKGGGFDRALVRVGTNADTDYVLHASHTATTTAQASLQAYATHVSAQIAAEGYDTSGIAPNDRLLSFGAYPTGDADVQSGWESDLDIMAEVINALNTRVDIQGFADRQMYPGSVPASDADNRELGNNRAQGIHDALHQRGVPTSLLNVLPSTGDQAAASAGDARGTNNPTFRRVDITSTRSFYLIIVRARSGGPNLHNAADISPNKIGDSSADNGFVLLRRPTPLNLSGKSVTIDSNNFPFDGTAVASFAANDPRAYALNLANDINGHASAALKASAQANVVTISRDGDAFQLSLVTAEQRNITISGTTGITVTSQFSRSRSSSLTRQNTGNRTVAVGASLDVRYSRKFEMNVTGNSSISARLVSVPAPPQFLETIKEYLTKEE
jgi:outer membrane protein OmpA-like peptidoglycan-associated protein